MCANSEGSGETARMRRLAWAFAARLCDKYYNLMSRLMTKPTKWSVRPAKTQISLGIRPVESSQCAQLVAKNPSFLHADSEDSGQTGRMPRLICVFDGRTGHYVGFVGRWFICFSFVSMFLLHACPFLFVSGTGYGLWLWQSQDFQLNIFHRALNIGWETCAQHSDMEFKQSTQQTITNFKTVRTNAK